MVLRQLGEDEKRLILRNIERIKEENQDLEVQIKDLQHKIVYILPFSFKQQHRDFTDKKRTLIQSVHSNNLLLTSLENQLNFGVETKEEQNGI